MRRMRQLTSLFWMAGLAFERWVHRNRTRNCLFDFHFRMAALAVLCIRLMAVVTDRAGQMSQMSLMRILCECICVLLAESSVITMTIDAALFCRWLLGSRLMANRTTQSKNHMRLGGILSRLLCVH